MTVRIASHVWLFACVPCAACAVAPTALSYDFPDGQVASPATVDADTPAKPSTPSEDSGMTAPTGDGGAGPSKGDAGASTPADAAAPVGPLLCDTQLSGVEQAGCTDCLGTSCCSQAKACEANGACLTFWNCKQSGKSNCQPPADQALSVVGLVQGLTSCASSSCGAACPTMVSM